MTISQNYEVEVKVLLGGVDQASKFKAAIEKLIGKLDFVGEGRQKNFYYNLDGFSQELIRLFIESNLCSPEIINELRLIFDSGFNLSMRTRQTDKETLFIVKYSLNDNSSHNGTIRRELEFAVSTEFEKLNQLIELCGYTIQAKWSRHRQEYKSGDFSITLDKNAGYGYLAEIEKQVDSPEESNQALSQIRSLLSKIGFEELDQARLERMFEFYNQNWADYYGTEKIFVVQ